MKIVEREDIGFFKTEIYPFTEPDGKHHPTGGCIVITPRRRKPNGTFVERPEITINMSVHSADIETAEVFAAAYARAIEIAREMAAQRENALLRGLLTQSRIALLIYANSTPEMREFIAKVDQALQGGEAE